MIYDWHQQAPFVHAFSHDSPWICLQTTRFPVVGLKDTYVIEWDHRAPTRIPVFHDARGLAMEWHDFVVTTSVTHVGLYPTIHHYKSILWHTGAALECDDFRAPMPLGCNVYLIWIVPSRLVSFGWRKPLPIGFVDLLGDLFA